MSDLNQEDEEYLGEGISELSLEDEINHVIVEDQIANSCERQNSPTSENRSCSGSLFNISNSTQDLSFPLSQSSGSQNKYRYLKLPILNQFFDKTKTSQDRFTNKCKSCGKLEKSGSISRLHDHASKCNFDNDIKQSLQDHYNSMVERDSDYLSLLWASVIVECNFSLSCVENRKLRKFFKSASPDWGRTQLTRENMSNCIALLARKADRRFNSRLKSTANYQFNLVFDHWSDISKRSLLGIVIVERTGYKHLCNLIDVSIEGHYADVSAKKIKSSISTITPMSLNCIISDAASACTNARKIITTDPEYHRYNHMIQLRC